MDRITPAFQRIGSFLNREKAGDLSRAMCLSDFSLNFDRLMSFNLDGSLCDKQNRHLDISLDETDLRSILEPFLADGHLSLTNKNIVKSKIFQFLQIIATLRIHGCLPKIVPTFAGGSDSEEAFLPAINDHIIRKILLQFFDAYVIDIKSNTFESVCDIWTVVSMCDYGDFLRYFTRYLQAVNHLKPDEEVASRKGVLFTILHHWTAVDSLTSKIFHDIKSVDLNLVQRCSLATYDRLWDWLTEDFTVIKSIFVNEMELLHNVEDTAALCRLVATLARISTRMQQTYDANAKRLSLQKTQLNKKFSPQGHRATEADSKSDIDEFGYQEAENVQEYSLLERRTFFCNLDNESNGDQLKGVLKGNTDTQRRTSCHSDIESHSTSNNLNLLRQLHQHPEIMHYLHGSMTKCLQQYFDNLSIAIKPVSMDWSSSNCDSSSPSLGSGYLLPLLLQTPVFATSSYGPLFTTPGVSIVDDTQDEIQTSLHPRLGLDFLSQRPITSWMGCAVTATGIPEPCLIVSTSVRDMVSFVVDSLLPFVLVLMEADLQADKHAYTSQLCSASGDGPQPIPQFVDCQAKFRSCILSILGRLVSFLMKNNNKTTARDCKEGNLTTQLTSLILSVGEMDLYATTDTLPIMGASALQPIEKMALAISDCLILRALCQLIANLFRYQFKVTGALLTNCGGCPTVEGDLSSEMMEYIKQYDRSIRVLAEHLVDLTGVYCSQLAFDISRSSTGCAEQSHTLAAICTPSILVHCSNLFQLWGILSVSCPGGLARQALAHSAAEYFTSAVQQLVVVSGTEKSTETVSFLNDLWLLLKTAVFVLFCICENVSEIVGFGILPTSIDILHSSAMLLMQLLVCRLSPPAIWQKHYGTVEDNIIKDQRFDPAVSNWLCFVAPTVFWQPPVTLMQQDSKKIEMIIIWDLFIASRHFMPTLLLNLMTSWEFQFVLALLSNSRLLYHPAVLTDYQLVPSFTEAIDFVSAVYSICAALPDASGFFSETLNSAFQREETRRLFSCDRLPVADNWPIWLCALMKLLDETLMLLWKRFSDLVNFTVANDDSLKPGALALHSDQSPRTILDNHCPKRPDFWELHFPSGKLPCNCDLPMPIALTVSDFDEMVSIPSSRSHSDSDQHHRDAASLTFYKFYTGGGRIAQVWHEFALDLLRMVVVCIPAALQPAFTQLQETHDASVNAEDRLYFVADNVAVHFVFLYLHNKINSSEKHGLIDMACLQHLILLEYLCKLITSSQHFVKSKQHILASLEEAKLMTVNTPERTNQSCQGKAFRVAELAHYVQQSALPELCLVSKFLRHHAAWIRNEVILYEWMSHTPIIHMDPHLEGRNPPSDLLDILPISPDSVDWTGLCSINLGITKETVDLLR